jgi:hypothetical protein
MAYQFKKTIYKVLISLAEIIAAGVVVYLTDNNLYIGLVPLAQGIRNWIKHR